MKNSAKWARIGLAHYPTVIENDTKFRFEPVKR